MLKGCQIPHLTKHQLQQAKQNCCCGLVLCSFCFASVSVFSLLSPLPFVLSLPCSERAAGGVAGHALSLSLHVPVSGRRGTPGFNLSHQLHHKRLAFCLGRVCLAAATATNSVVASVCLLSVPSCRVCLLSPPPVFLPFFYFDIKTVRDIACVQLC